jgi:hypothetical protein
MFSGITIISIIRIKSLQVISFTEPTYTLPMGLWTTLEPCLCIINANLPMVRTVLVEVVATIFGSTKDQTSRRTPHRLSGSGPGPLNSLVEGIIMATLDREQDYGRQGEKEEGRRYH